MEPWEDELLWDDDFSDEEEDTEEQIEEPTLKWMRIALPIGEDASDGAPENESLEEALAEERTLELESELEQDEHPRNYAAELEERGRGSRAHQRKTAQAGNSRRGCAGGWRKQPGRNRIF